MDKYVICALLMDMMKHEMLGHFDEATATRNIIDDNLRAVGGVAADTPHFIWHFLADVDIRSKPKEQVYAIAHYHSLVDEIVEWLGQSRP